MSSQNQPSMTHNLAHKRQVVWQIWLPLTLFILIFFGLCSLAVLLTTRGSITVAQWSALSVIIVIFPVFIVGFFTFILLILGIFLIGKATQKLPTITSQLQTHFQRLFVIVHYYSDRLASPIINIQGKWAGITSLFRPTNKSENKK
jgi:hypothetical protein